MALRRLRPHPEEATYFQFLDVARHSKIIERRLLAAIEEFLEANGIDTSEFVQRAEAILNYGMIIKGTNIVGGDMIAGCKPSVIRVTTSERALLKSVREHVAADPVEREHDIFLSHATADRALARTLHHALKKLDADVWVDEFSLGLGQDIVRAIDRGIARSRIGVVLVTPTVIAGRPWVEKEFSALIDGKETVIPILHEVTWKELQTYSPLLHLKKGLSTADRAVEEIAKLIVSALDGGRVK